MTSQKICILSSKGCQSPTADCTVSSATSPPSIVVDIRFTAFGVCNRSRSALVKSRMSWTASFSSLVVFRIEKRREALDDVEILRSQTPSEKRSY